MRSVIARAPAAGDHLTTVLRRMVLVLYVSACVRCLAVTVNVPTVHTGTPQGGSEVAKVGMACHHAPTESWVLVSRQV